MVRTISALIVLAVSFALCQPLQAGEKEAKQVLSDHGIRVLGSSLALKTETTLSKSLRSVTKLRKSLFNANKESDALQRKHDTIKKTITVLKLQHVQLSAQLAKINPNNIALNNKLVGALNAVKGQVDLLTEQQEQLTKLTKETRAKSVAAREKYIQHVLDMRDSADKTSQAYTTEAADEEVKTALAELNRATGKKYELTPSRGFQSSLRRLKTLEDSVLSETINLRKTKNDSLYVSVVINGKHTKEMVLDSGASLISLPAKLAAECGLEPTASDPDLTLELANGMLIPAKLVIIPEVRVGKFTVKNVECAVLGPEATSATPLLGMSFLGHFKFEISAQASTLKMVKVETSTSSRTSPRRKKP